MGKLVNSYHIYQGKDHLRLLKRSGGRHPLESKLHALNVETVSFESILAKLPELTQPGSAGTDGQTDEKMDERYLFAARRVQRFWRRVAYPAILRRRKQSSNPMGALKLRFRDFSAKRSLSKELCDLVTSEGVKVHSSHGTQTKKAEDLQKRAVALVESLPSERLDENLEAVSGVIDCVREYVERLESMAPKVTAEALEQLLSLQDAGEANSELAEVSKALEKAGKELSDAERILKNVA